MIRTQFDSLIRAFRANSTGEDISSAHWCFLAQFSCPSAHARNGVAERKHRHILETSHALILSSELPPHFCDEAASTAISH